MADLIIPEGFKPFEKSSPFAELNGPYFFHDEGDKTCEFGFLPGEQHANTNGILHGGALFSFIDTCFGATIRLQLQHKSATVSITTEYIAAGKPGQWMVGKTKVKKRTRTMAFVNGEVYHEDQLLLSTTGVFKLFPMT